MKVKKNFVKTVGITAMACVTMFSGCSNGVTKKEARYGEIVGTENTTYAPTVIEVSLDKERAKDKILGMIVGNAIGLGSGWEYVVDNGVPVVNIEDKYFETNGEVATGTLGNNVYHYGPYDPTYQRVSKGVLKSDDDQTVNFFNMQILKDYGVAVSYEDICNAWEFYDVADAAGGESAMKLIKQKDYIAPHVGQNVYGNYYYACTEPWIGNNMLGVLFPGMPSKAESYIDLFGSISGDGSVLDLARIFGLVNTYAMTENDARVCLAKAMNHIEKSNILYDTYQYVLNCYEEDPSDWRSCVSGIFEKKILNEHLYTGMSTMVSQMVNGGFMMTAIVFGENDFTKSLKIASLAGYDGDCTAASVGGLLALCHGYSGLLQKYRDFYNENSLYINDKTWFACIKKNYPSQYTFGDLTDEFIDNLEMFVKEFGGEITETEYKIKGEDIIFPQSPIVDDYGFEDGKLDVWEKIGNADFYISGMCAHSGKKAGTVLIGNKDTEIFRTLDGLIKGDTYVYDLFVYSSSNITFEMFARDGENEIKSSYGNPLAGSNLHTHVSLTFTAIDTTMQIGVRVFGNDESKIFTFDDIKVRNVSNVISQRYSTFDAVGCKLFTGAKVIEADTYTGSAVQLSNGAGLEFVYENTNKFYNSYRIYYDYKNKGCIDIRVFVDGEYLCKLPMLPKGGNGFDAGYAEIRLHVGEGKHTIRFQTVQGETNTIIIDRIEIREGDLRLI